MQNTEQTQLFTRRDLVKKYVQGETKEQRKARKELEKAQKSVKIPQKLPQKIVDEKYYVLCLKHGNKYSSEYVNILYGMVKRHCTIDIEFVCLTDNPNGLNPNITSVSLPNGIDGWWCKPYMFSNDIPIRGTVLYMDLDVVIADNIDHLFTFASDSWSTIRDFTRKQRPSWQKYNSSVVKFQTGKMDYLWQQFKKNQTNYQKRLHGDQDWLYEVTHKDNPATLFPDNWIQSWKWEIRNSKDLNYNMPRGRRTLRTIEHVTPPNGCCICVFHGDPNPAFCDDPWVKQNWKI